MALIKKNINNQPNPRVALEKQQEKVTKGLYGVHRIFMPSEKGSAALCTPYFRVNLSKQEWETIKDQISSDTGLMIEWNGYEWAANLDAYGLFGITYEGDDYGCHHNYEDPEYLYLTFDEYKEGKEAIENANKEVGESQEAPKGELPF